MANEVDYVAAARRHFQDASLLRDQRRQANAGQLFGFSIECGVKAVLLVAGVARGDDGGIAPKMPEGKGKPHPLRTHVPRLFDEILVTSHLLGDGRLAHTYVAKLSSRDAVKDWSVDHRYWNEKKIPLGSLPAWEKLAGEVNAMLDQAQLDGVLF